jgi:hypothetical protein
VPCPYAYDGYMKKTSRLLTSTFGILAFAGTLLASVALLGAAPHSPIAQVRERAGEIMSAYYAADWQRSAPYAEPGGLDAIMQACGASQRGSGC